MIRDNTLFMYHNNTSSIPSTILFMRGLYIADKGWSKSEQMYQFCISGIDLDKSKQTKYFYHPERKVLNKWIDNLKKAAEDFDFTDKYFKGKLLGQGKFA